jgi:hypothetical protein
VSDFIETLQIIPSGTTPFVNQAIGQGSRLISVYDYQGGTAYTAANLFTVNAGDKIHFNWKQSGWVQTFPGATSYVICYIVKGTNPVPQAGDRIEVGRIHQYIYGNSDHEEIAGSFVYNVTSTFSFYRSQVEGGPNLVTQGQDYGAATATVYRATVPNSITVPNLIDATNISVVNLSVTGELSATFINASDVHTEALNVSGSAAVLSDGLTVVGLTTTQNISTNHISSTGFITADGDIRASGGFRAIGGSGIISTGAIQFNNANDGTGDSLEIYYTGTQFGMGTTSGKDFTINAGYSTGGLVVDGTINNINMSNCSINNLSADNISTLFLSTTQIRMKDPADPAVTKGSIFCNPIAFQYYGPNQVFFNNTVSPNVEYMRMDSSKSNVNISNLSSTNTSILNDMTITRDLDVDRYLSYKPRFLTRWRDNVYNITGTAQDVQWNRDETAMAGGALQVSGDGIQALLAGWYRVDWSIGYRKINNNGGERLTARTYLRINNIFYGKYGYGSSTYLRSSSINRIGFSSGSQLVYANVNDIIHVRTDCIIQANVDFTSDFGGQRILANSRFSCEYVSNSGET